jgi:hypothetical protein
MKQILLIILAFFSFNAFTHEGHNQTPGSVKSKHGGVVSLGKQVNLEILVNGTNVTLYPLTHESVDLKASDVKVSAIAKPRKGSSYPLVFKALKLGFSADVDLKGSNRVELDINIEQAGKLDKFKVQVEQ